MSVTSDLNLIVPTGVILNDIVVYVEEHLARQTLFELQVRPNVVMAVDVVLAYRF